MPRAVFAEVLRDLRAEDLQCLLGLVRKWLEADRRWRQASWCQQSPASVAATKVRSSTESSRITVVYLQLTKRHQDLCGSSAVLRSCALDAIEQK